MPGHPHDGTANGHFSVDVGASLLKVDGYFGCGEVGLISTLASFFEECIVSKAIKSIFIRGFYDKKLFSFCISSAAVGTRWLRQWGWWHTTKQS
jgi:hypothetical protein